MVRRATRLGDRVRLGESRFGAWVTASSNVLIEERRAVRRGDAGLAPSMDEVRAKGAARYVLVNHRRLHRISDVVTGPDGGSSVQGAAHVLVGDESSYGNCTVPWLEVLVVDDDGNPVAERCVRVEFTGGHVVFMTTDGRGIIRVVGGRAAGGAKVSIWDKNWT